MALKALSKTDIVFTRRYIEEQVSEIAKTYSEVTALDFCERDALDILKYLRTISDETFEIIVSRINKEMLLSRWNQCAGIQPRKRKWVEKRKKELLEMIDRKQTYLNG